MSGHILIVDDEKTILQALGGILADEEYEVSLAPDGETALNILNDELPDLVLLDIWMPGIDGLEVLKIIKEQHPGLPVVIISGHGNVETAIRAVRLGAFDFIEKPLDADKILLVTRNALNFSRLSEAHQLLQADQPRLNGGTAAIEELRRTIELAAVADSWVLITGESGVGKELVAHALHRLSRRAHQPLVDVNCAAIPEELIESELFGHEKGAFTGAVARKRGKFDLADQGTLFLDEIADMSLKTQAKILRILQEQRFERVGGSKTIKVDVRVLAATNKDLTVEIKEGRFREDLYYRLNVIPIHVPPLRQRASDIPALAQEFLHKHALKYRSEPKSLTPAALEYLMNQPWPGNVRQLKNLLERLCILTPGAVIDVGDLPPNLESQPPDPGQLPLALSSDDFKEARAAFERMFLEQKLAQYGGNISRISEAIGLERSHLSKKLKALEIKFDPK